MQIDKGAGCVVAAEVGETVSAMDEALLCGARMVVSVLETAKGSHIPAGQTQKLFAAMTSGLNAVVTGRAEIVSAMRHMTVIKNQSNLAPVSFGCPDGWSKLSADAGDQPAVAEAA